MRKALLKSVAIVLVMMIAFSSCNNNEEIISPTLQDQKSAIEGLKSEIEQLNNEKFGNAQIAETRLPKWLRWLITAVADVGVSVIPGSNIGYGIAASTLVWTFTKADCTATNPNIPSIYPSEISLSYVTQLSPISTAGDDFGYIHNKVIVELYNIYGEGLFDIPLEQLLPLVGHKVAEITGKPYVIPSFTDEQNAIKLLQISTNLYKQSETISQYINGLKIQNPSIANELNVLQVTLEGYEQIDIHSDKGIYAQEVIQLVNKANISDYSKQVIVSGVSVANASTRLWNTASLSSSNDK